MNYPPKNYPLKNYPLKNYPNTWYMMDLTRIVCPHAMKPMTLFVTREFSRGEVAESLLHYQREAHRVGTETIPPETPLLGTPAHCIVGAAPPWRTYKGVKLLPEVIELIVERHSAGKLRLAPRVFAGECGRVFQSRGMTPAKRETVFHRVNPIAYDVFFVYAALVKSIVTENNEDTEALHTALARHEILQAILNGGPEEAERISNEICDALEKLSAAPPFSSGEA